MEKEPNSNSNKYLRRQKVLNFASQGDIQSRVQSNFFAQHLFNLCFSLAEYFSDPPFVVVANSIKSFRAVSFDINVFFECKGTTGKIELELELVIDLIFLTRKRN